MRFVPMPLSYNFIAHKRSTGFSAPPRAIGRTSHISSRREARAFTFLPQSHPAPMHEYSRVLLAIDERRPQGADTGLQSADQLSRIRLRAQTLSIVPIVATPSPYFPILTKQINQKKEGDA
jgi:hypothetical protein